MKRKPPSTEPLRGEAAWLAAKKEVSAHNDAAHARALEQRASRNEDFAKARRLAERREDEILPVQPRP